MMNDFTLKKSNIKDANKLKKEIDTRRAIKI